MAVGIAFVNMEKRELKFRLNDKEVTSYVYRIMKQPTDIRVVSVINYVYNPVSHFFGYLDEV